MTIALLNPYIGLLTILVGIFGVGRLTRAIVYDDFPPSVWWRNTWSTWTKDGPWSKLFLCWWCLSFWVSLVCVVWFLLIEVHPFFMWSWWIFWGSLALGYVATMIIVRDTPSDEE